MTMVRQKQTSRISVKNKPNKPTSGFVDLSVNVVWGQDQPQDLFSTKDAVVNTWITSLAVEGPQNPKSFPACWAGAGVGPLQGDVLPASSYLTFRNFQIQTFYAYHGITNHAWTLVSSYFFS